MTELPPIGWFRNPELTEPTPFTIDPDGRVRGHVALWGASHRSFPNRRITPPRSRTDYALFHVGGTLVTGDDGEPVTIPTGNLAEGGHADTSLGMGATQSFYDDPAKIVATCCVGDDDVGIWMAGALLPGVARDELRVARLRATAMSGDWRAHDSGGLELCAVALVNCPGFPIPRARVASGAPLALVAAGVVQSAGRFGRRVADGWTAPAAAGSSRLRVSMADLVDEVAARLDERRRAAELSARCSELLTDLDDTPVLVASLLDQLDDTGERVTALLAELDDEDVSEEDIDDLANWVEKAGGLPQYIKRISKHLRKKGMSESHAIATAVNAAKRMCSSGDLNFPGVQEVNPGSRAEACAAVAEWERMKAQAKAKG